MKVKASFMRFILSTTTGTLSSPQTPSLDPLLAYTWLTSTVLVNSSKVTVQCPATEYGQTQRNNLQAQMIDE